MTSLQSDCSTVPQHILLITGPAGSGKTTVASTLAKNYELPYLEGDNFHTPENVEKMRSGHALTDADRWEWLARVREAAVNALQPQTSPHDPSSRQSNDSAPTGDSTSANANDAIDPPTTSLGPGSTAARHPEDAAKISRGRFDHARAPAGVVVTCSALKKTYRDVIRKADSDDSTDDLTGKAQIKVTFVFLSLPEDVLYKRVRERVGHYMKEDMVKSQIEVLEYPDEQERHGDVLVIDATGSKEQVENDVEAAVQNATSLKQR